MKKTKHTIVGFVTVMIIGMVLLGGAKTAVNACISEPVSTEPVMVGIETKEETEPNYEDREEIEFHENLDKFEEARNVLAVEVHEYITSVAPKSQIDPYILIDLCKEYNVDVAFVMAQGQIESHYATKGTARRTNSIFNVGAYDGHSAERQCKNGFGFEDPNDSIEPFLILLTNDYLVNGKTIDDLMINYVNYLDMRYASNRKYESQIKSVYNKIYRNPEFRMAYEEYKECWIKIC